MKYNKNEVTGKMRDRIILQNVNRSRSLTGFASESWADVATIWAFAESKLPGSNETIIEGKNTAKNICDFTIRYISSITEESRVVWGDKLYQVKNLKVSHDRRFISFQGVFYDSYILTGVNVAASVNGIATTSANLKLIMSVIGQANAIASAIGELTVFQQGVVEVAASASATATTSANVTKVINIDSSVDANANISAPLTIAKNIQSTVDANANISAELKLSKTLVSSVNANATATSILDVVTQGIVSLDASVAATGTTTANLSRIATLVSSPSTAADTSAIATLTKVLEATATATANTDASAQLTIPVNASATATAETSANAQLSYTVNAEATATAETSAEAQIVRIISASATATAESTAEASFGVTFAANVEGTATVDNATIARAATMVASVTGQATVTGATLTTVDNVAASVSAAATVTNATLNVGATLLLDLYPSAAVAYSLRKLRSAYTGIAIKVRASTSGAEGDVSFDVNNIISSNSTVTVTAVGTSGLSIGQQVTFSTFWNAGGSNQNVFVVTWYDQSGNSRDASQTTQANQPQIVNNGSIITVTGTGTARAALLFDGTNDLLTRNFLNFTDYSVFSIHKKGSIVNTATVAYQNGSTGGYGLNTSLLNAQLNYSLYEAGVADHSFGTPTTNLRLISGVRVQSSSILNGYVNATLFTMSPSPVNTPTGNFSIGAFPNGMFAFNGHQSELIFYSTNQTSNIAAIQTNINLYYGIY